MALFPGSLIPWVDLQFHDEDGNPLSLGSLETYVAGTMTPQETFTDVDLTSANPTTIDLDAAGRPPDPIFLPPSGFKFIAKDADGNEQWTLDYIEDVGQVFASQFGILQTQGSSNVTTGFTQLTTDRFVTVDSSAGAVTFNLLPAADFTQTLVIKNLGANTIAVTPDGTDTLDGLNAAYTIPAASSPNYPSIELSSDGVSSVWIRASHGL